MSAFRQVRKPNPMAYYAEKIIANAMGKRISSATPIIDLTDFYIEPQKAYKILDIGERGELLFVEIAANSALIIPEIILWNEKGEPITPVNTRTFQQLLALGRGLTPGDVQPTATGQTQDTRSTFIPNMFHLSRYKDDQLSDWVDTSTENPNPDRYIVGKIVCMPPMPYSSISIYIKNTTTDSNKKVYSVSVGRTVYEDSSVPRQDMVQPETVRTVEIAGDEIEVQSETELPPVEDINVNYYSQPG